MPFLPPPTEEIDSEITCTLVFYPSGDAYRRALFGNLAELTEAWNWEASKADQLAIRQVWLNAYLQTLECNDMGCLDDVLALLEEIRDKDVCCESVSSVPGGDEITGIDDSTLPPDVDRGGADFPDGWTGGATTFDPYLCGQAHRLADTTDGAVDAVADTILIASNVVVFATLVVLAFGNVIGMGIAAILAGGYSLVTISEIFGFFSFFTELREALGAGDPSGLVAQTKSEMAAAHDDIVTAVACSNDAAAAIMAMDAVVDDNVTSGSYAALLKLTYRMAIRPIFWGFGSAPDRSDCTCGAHLVYQGATYTQGPVTLDSVLVQSGGFEWSILEFEFRNLSGSNAAVSVTQWDADPGILNETSSDTWRVYNVSDTETYGSDSKPSIPTAGHRFRNDNRLASGNDRGSFSVTVDW